MKNSNFGEGYSCYGDDDGYGYGTGYGAGFGFGYDYNGYGHSDGYGQGYGDADSWIKIGQIENDDVFILSQWPYIKIGNEIHSLKIEK